MSHEADVTSVGAGHGALSVGVGGEDGLSEVMTSAVAAEAAARLHDAVDAHEEDSSPCHSTNARVVDHDQDRESVASFGGRGFVVVEGASRRLKSPPQSTTNAQGTVAAESGAAETEGPPAIHAATHENDAVSFVAGAALDDARSAACGEDVVHRVDQSLAAANPLWVDFNERSAGVLGQGYAAQADRSVGTRRVGTQSASHGMAMTRDAQVRAHSDPELNLTQDGDGYQFC